MLSSFPSKPILLLISNPDSNKENCNPQIMNLSERLSNKKRKRKPFKEFKEKFEWDKSKMTIEKMTIR